jgi:predicted ATP-dependent endonuclease of OLD family
MKLTKVRVQNYKSTVDSGIVDIEDGVTVVIGKNEQGKTTFLKALASWNPKVNYGPTDLPNHLRHELERQKGSTIPIVTLWVRTEPSEVKKIGVSETLGYKEFKCVRYYDGHREYLGVKQNGTEELLTFAPLPVAGEIGRIKAAATILKDKLQAHAARHQEFQAHVPQSASQIDQFLSADFAKIDQLENLIKTFSTSLRSLPGQDAAIQEDIASAIKELETVHAEIVKAAAIDKTAILENSLPNFVFHSTNTTLNNYVPNDVSIAEFVANPEAASKGMANLCAVAGLSMQKIKELAESPDVIMRQTFEDTYNSKVSGGINDIWTQEDYSVHFRFEPAKMFVSISDNTYARRIAPRDRSDGFQWYLSFYAAIQSEGSASRATVFLLDNPGLELHADGQRDIKRYLEELPNEQVIYVTHSAAMIDPFRLEQVRQVERGPEGTMVGELSFKEGGDFDLLEPVRSAIGASLASSLVLNELNVLVEGAADKPILEGAFALLRPTYTKKILINGSISESKDGFLVSFYKKANLPFIVFLDADDNGRRLAGSLAAKGVAKERMLMIDRAIGRESRADLELEDILSASFYYDAVKAAYPEREFDMPKDADGKRTRHYNDSFRAKFGFGFNKRRVAIEVKKLLTNGKVDTETRANLQKVTDAILTAVDPQSSQTRSENIIKNADSASGTGG